MRELKFFQAIHEATEQCMEEDPRVYVIGLGTTDPKGTFGTTLGLEKKYGTKRIMDMPTSENAMAGVIIGSALTGMRPIMCHQRVDFNLLALDQIINNAAKWHYMFGGKQSVPIVIRMVIGRGWGQGPQHSQSLQALFAHIPGLKVVMPATPHDAKGLLIASVEDNNPVIFLEHRWLHGIFGDVPREMYRVSLGKAHTIREGSDVSIVANGYMTIEALHAAQILASDPDHPIDVEVIDLCTLKPLDTEHILQSVRKTGRLMAADAAWKTLSVAGEIISLVSEELFHELKCAPVRIAFPDCPTPSTRALADVFYPRVIDLVNSVRTMMGLEERNEDELGLHQKMPLDVPDTNFTGPF